MRSVALVASAWLLLAPAARGESRADTPPPAVEAAAARDDGRRTLRLFPVNLLRAPSLVGVSRLQRNKHYLSDVLAGATLGYIVERTVVRVNGQPIEARRARR